MSGATETERADARREKTAVALSSVLAAVVLTGAKAGVGLATGSLGLLAEAAHSGLDLVAALLTLFAVRYAERPADRQHPYGHGRAENLSAFIEAGLLLVTCAWIIWEAVHRLLLPEVHVDASLWAFLVVGGSIVIDFGRSRALSAAAERHSSQALAADALHFKTDIWSSAVVLLGLIGVRIGEWTGNTELWGRADAVAALGVSGIVVVVSLRLLHETIDALLDRAPEGLETAVLAAARAVPGVLDARRLRLRRAGNKLFADLVIDVPRTTSFPATHDIAEAVEAAVQRVVPTADVVVHVEPAVSPNERTAEQIHLLARQQGVRAHDVRLRRVGGQFDADLHLEVPPEMTLARAHAAADSLESAVLAANPAIRSVNVHLEAPGDEEAHHEELTARLPELQRRIERIADEVAGLGATHEVRIYRHPDEADVIDLVLHIDFPADAPVDAVHEASSRIERLLRARLPGLGTVLIHAEPSGGAASQPRETYPGSSRTS